MSTLHDAQPHEPRADDVWDAGPLACGELVLELRRRLMEKPGRIVRVIALDPGAPEDIPAWCRLTGNSLLHQDPRTQSFWIEARPRDMVRASPTASGSSTEADPVYSAKIFALAQALPAASHLPSPDATGTAHSKLCGSTAAVDIVVRNGIVEAYAQRIDACLLGRATASVVARTIVGTSIEDVRKVTDEIRTMLSTGAKAPEGRWSDLAALAPVRDLKSRHPSTLLIFVAIERALDTLPR
ncbi:MAG: sulfurtransferase TusA family protein [Hyphomicrobiales bacterium]|nr:sulfurtransferase TusA family protein [Hyphomicrobiales bacterium]